MKTILLLQICWKLSVYYACCWLRSRIEWGRGGQSNISERALANYTHQTRPQATRTKMNIKTILQVENGPVNDHNESGREQHSLKIRISRRFRIAQQRLDDQPFAKRRRPNTQLLFESCYFMQYVRPADEIRRSVAAISASHQNVERSGTVNGIKPRLARKLHIESQAGPSAPTYTIKWDQTYTARSTKALRTAMMQFAPYVKHFKFSSERRRDEDGWMGTVKALQMCKNLKTIRITYDFDITEAYQFQELLVGLKDLKSLKLINCTGLTKVWLPNFGANTSIAHLTLKMRAQHISQAFLDYFKRLTSVKLRFPGCERMVTQVLTHYGNALQSVNLSDGYCASIDPILCRQLKHLTVTVCSTDFVPLPCLKKVRLVFGETTLNAMLRKLSDCGIIERIEICSGIVTSVSSADRRPLRFQNLHTLRIRRYTAGTVLWPMRAYETPELRYVKITIWSEHNLMQLWCFVEAKPSLRTIRIRFRRDANISYEFWTKLVDMLRTPCTPKREFLCVRIPAYKFAKRTVRYLFLLKL